jgi:hypothetical protein
VLQPLVDHQLATLRVSADNTLLFITLGGEKREVVCIKNIAWQKETLCLCYPALTDAFNQVGQPAKPTKVTPVEDRSYVLKVRFLKAFKRYLPVLKRWVSSVSKDVIKALIVEWMIKGLFG